ncbi:MAG TPA: DUF2219 family protein, partial [Saprospiraceae bacterium]|nr:DUF2219 family protein [Saprospiraceae bacterium]
SVFIMKKYLIKFMKYIILFCLFLQSITAQNINKYFSIYTEEDFYPILIDSNKALDENYTMGFGFGWSCSDSMLLYLTRLRKQINKKISNFLNIVNYDTDAGNLNYNILEYPRISLNGGAFTPDRIEDYNISYDDRPYSFLLSYQASQTFLRNDYRRALTYTLAIGLYGTGIGKFVQTAIHESLNDHDTKNPRTPRGWPHQIKCEPSFLYKISKSQLCWPKNIGKDNYRSYFEVSYSKELLIGYYTGFAAETNLRIGLLDSRNWFNRFNNLNDVNKKNEVKGIYKNRLWEFYLYFNAKPQLIFYNEGLSGGFRNSDYVLTPLKDTNPFIIELSTGIAASIPYCKCGSLNIAWCPFSLKSPEMWGNKIIKTHYFGGVYITLNY